jgi:hypothetical protein
VHSAAMVVMDSVLLGVGSMQRNAAVCRAALLVARRIKQENTRALVPG